MEWEIMGKIFPERFRIFGWNTELEFYKKMKIKQKQK